MQNLRKFWSAAEFPQGSIFGLTRCKLYMNDLILCTDLFGPILFADDTNLVVKHKKLNMISKTVNEYFDNIFQWGYRNKLTHYVEKTNTY